MQTLSPRFLGLLLGLALAAATAPAPAATVTACQDARQAGSGLNLRQALVQDTAVDFDCPAGSVIRVTAPLRLTRSTRIDGRGQVALDGGRTSQIFIGRGASDRIELTGLALRSGGREPQVAALASTVVDIAGTLVLQQVEVLGSDAPLRARAIEVSGASRFAFNSSTVLRTQTLLIGAGAVFEDNAGEPFASANFGAAATAEITGAQFLRNRAHARWDGSLHIVDSSFLGNSASGARETESAHGGALRLSGAVVIETSRFNANRAEGSGGALLFDRGSLKMRRCSFDDNVAGAGGGGLSFSHVSEDASPATMELSYGRFSRNRAMGGGALDISGTAADRAVLRNLVFQGNEAAGGVAAPSSGGALSLNGSVVTEIQRSSFLDNRAEGDGAALHQRHSAKPGRLRMSNSVVARNRNLRETRGALTVANADFIHVTVTRNDGGLALTPVPLLFGQGPRLFFGTVKISNSVLADNAAGNCRLAPFNVTLQMSGTNLQFPGKGCGAGVASADPQLDDFFVAGPTSPARRAADPARCSAAPVAAIDLLGERRERGLPCTLGAVENTVEKEAVRRLLRVSSPEELPALLRALRQQLWPRGQMRAQGAGQ